MKNLIDEEVNGTAWQKSKIKKFRIFFYVKSRKLMIKANEVGTLNEMFVSPIPE